MASSKLNTEYVTTTETKVVEVQKEVHTVTLTLTTEEAGIIAAALDKGFNWARQPADDSTAATSGYGSTSGKLSKALTSVHNALTYHYGYSAADREISDARRDALRWLIVDNSDRGVGSSW